MIYMSNIYMIIKKRKDLDYDETRLSPTLIIDDHYVYSFQNFSYAKGSRFWYLDKMLIQEK